MKGIRLVGSLLGTNREETIPHGFILDKLLEREKVRERDEIHYQTKGLQENYDLVYHYTKVSNL